MGGTAYQNMRDTGELFLGDANILTGNPGELDEIVRS